MASDRASLVALRELIADTDLTLLVWAEVLLHKIGRRFIAPSARDTIA